MNALNRRSALATLAAFTVAGTTGRAHAQPLGSVRILYGFPAGSAGDTVARAIAQRLGGTPYTSGNVTVENRIGAGSRLAMEALKAAPPDGSVLALVPMAMMVIYPHVFRKLNFDAAADFVPVGMAGTSQLGLVVGPAVPPEVTNINTFLAWAKAHPDRAGYGSPGAGATPHFLGALLGMSQGVLLRHVAYRGVVPGMADLVAGRVPAMMVPAGDGMAPHRSGQARMIATSGAQRCVFSPDVATFAEQGFGDLVTEEWFAFYAPAGTPAGVVAQANAAINAALQQSEVVGKMASVGMTAQGSSSEDMVRLQRADFERWGPLVKRVGFTADS